MGILSDKRAEEPGPHRDSPRVIIQDRTVRNEEISWPSRYLPAQIAQAMIRLARDLKVWLIPGTLMEKGDDGKFYNTIYRDLPGGEVGRQVPERCTPQGPSGHRNLAASSSYSIYREKVA